MKTFAGFPEGQVRFTQIPDPFFNELLPEINHIAELKTTLYAFWRLANMEGRFRYLQRENFRQDEEFMQGLANKAKDAEVALDDALERCLERGTFIKATLEIDSRPVDYFFLNTSKGRAAVQAIANGEWRHSSDPSSPLEVLEGRPSIYSLYEENIGPLTPMIAETLQDAEDTYPQEWIEHAVRIAVENNVRRWSYVDAILRRWQEGGRDEREDRRDTEKDRRRYVEGELSDFIDN